MSSPAKPPAGVPRYGSDLVVDLLRAAGIEHVALNPGATFRGLHDSLVNYAGDAGARARSSPRTRRSPSPSPTATPRRRGGPMAAVVHDIVGPPAREHGHLQRVLRSRPDPGARRHRPDGHDAPSTLDRLDPHRARAGHAGPRLRQAGRPAGERGRHSRGIPARVAARPDGAAWPRLPVPRRRASGGIARAPHRAARRRALPAGHAAACRSARHRRRGAPARGRALAGDRCRDPSAAGPAWRRRSAGSPSSSPRRWSTSPPSPRGDRAFPAVTRST